MKDRITVFSIDITIKILLRLFVFPKTNKLLLGSFLPNSHSSIDCFPPKKQPKIKRFGLFLYVSGLFLNHIRVLMHNEKRGLFVRIKKQLFQNIQQGVHSDFYI